jgi:drug/metabolite transporter (DMT)-like permease
MSRKRAHLLLSITALLWGINFISLKYLSSSFPPYSLVFIKFAIGSLFLWSLLLGRRKNDPSLKKLEKVDYKSILITGMVGFTLYAYFQLFSFSYLSANLAALLCALVPIFSLIAEVVFLKKKCSPITYLLSALSLYGVYLVLDMKPTEFLGSKAIWGILLMVFANICWVIYTMITKDLQEKYGSFSSLTYQMTAGTLFLSIASLGDLRDAIQTLSASTSAHIIILNLLFVGIGTSAIAYLFYIEGMEVIGIQLSSLYINFIPVVTAIASFFIFRESLNLKQLLGIILVVTSIVLINKVEDHYNRRKKALKPTYTI